MEKPKRSISPRRKILSIILCIVGLVLVCFGTGILISALMPMFYGQIPQTSLDPAFVAGTEALLDMPRELVLWDDMRLSFKFVESSDERNRTGYDFIYVSAIVDSLIYRNGDFDRDEYRNLLHNSRLSIDGVWVMGIEPNDMSCQGDDFNMDIDWCAWGHLQAGLHLIEFQLRNTPTGEPIHAQQWAIQIDN